MAIKPYKIRPTDRLTPGRLTSPVGSYVRPNPVTAPDGEFGAPYGMTPGVGSSPRLGVIQTGANERITTRFQGQTLRVGPNSLFTPQYKAEQPQATWKTILDALTGRGPDNATPIPAGVRGSLPTKGPHVNASIVPPGGQNIQGQAQGLTPGEAWALGERPRVAQPASVGIDLSGGANNRRPGDVTGIFSQNQQQEVSTPVSAFLANGQPNPNYHPPMANSINYLARMGVMPSVLTQNDAKGMAYSDLMQSYTPHLNAEGNGIEWVLNTNDLGQVPATGGGSSDPFQNLSTSQQRYYVAKYLRHRGQGRAAREARAAQAEARVAQTWDSTSGFMDLRAAVG